MACDICGKTGTTLDDLIEQYKTDKIEQLCPGCMKQVNDHLWKLRAMSNKMNTTWLKSFMQNTRKKLQD